MTRPSADPTEAAPLTLAVVLAVLAAVALQGATFLVTALAARFTGLGPGLGVALSLTLGSLAAWALAGAVAVEVARRRRAWAATACVPLVFTLAIASIAVVVHRVAFDREIAAGVASGLLLASAACLGGRFWERHIRRVEELQ